MQKSWVMCVFLTALAWGQAAPATPPPAPAGQAAAPSAAPKPQAPADAAAAVPATAAVITVNGVCPAQPKTAAAKAGAAKSAGAAAKTPAADCKTVITKAEFERIASAVAPSLTPQLKRQLAGVLPRWIAMSAAAQKQGLDKTPRFLELVKISRMQILTNELQRNIQEESTKVPDADILAYYQKNPEAYEQYNVDRFFVPRAKQVAAENDDKEDKEEKLTDEQQKAKEEKEKARQAEGEQEMTNLAESLRTRAAAGEDFLKLQKEAFDAAGMKIDSPTTNLLKVRRTGLPAGHSAVFELKDGEVSQVINDPSGHYVYRINKRQVLPLDQPLKDEIHSALQNQRMRDAMEKYQSSFKTETNEAYFGPGGPQGQPAPRGASLVRPNPAPSPAAAAKPQGQATTPPPAPAPKPN